MVCFIGVFLRSSLSLWVFWAADWLTTFFFIPLVWVWDLTWLTNQYMPLSVKRSVSRLAGVHACVDVWPCLIRVCVCVCVRESEGDTKTEGACAISNWVEQWWTKVSLPSRLLYPHSRQLVHRMDFTTALKATQTNVGFLQQGMAWWNEWFTDSTLLIYEFCNISHEIWHLSEAKSNIT